MFASFSDFVDIVDDDFLDLIVFGRCQCNLKSLRFYVYAQLSFTPTDYYGNVMQTLKFIAQTDIGWLRKTVPRTE